MKPSKDYILAVLRESADEVLMEPRMGIRKDRFKELSYQKSAVEELFIYISASDKEPEEAIEDFMAKAAGCAVKCHRSVSDIFTIAYDTGAWMLDILNAMKGADE